ncbi:peptidoglycan-binding protein [Streptomyces sp. NPDC056708]|uniref:peptidoglycan-binding domain-containing protein n=1 Tax=unclassified Streptomyces TaxID=2593676 RepID=UPI0036BF3479
MKNRTSDVNETERPTNHRGGHVIMRKRLAIVLTAAALTAGGIALAPAAQAAPASAQAYTCHYSWNAAHNMRYAGYYSGVTIVPSTVSVSNAGIEAQCLLKIMGYKFGTVDGVFGPNSQAAMKQFQRDLKTFHGVSVRVDGLPGPESWPWIRSYA